MLLIKLVAILNFHFNEKASILSSFLVEEEKIITIKNAPGSDILRSPPPEKNHLLNFKHENRYTP